MAENGPNIIEVDIMPDLSLSPQRGDMGRRTSRRRGELLSRVGDAAWLTPPSATYVVVRDLSQQPDRSPRILGSAASMAAPWALVAYASMVMAASSSSTPPTTRSYWSPSSGLAAHLAAARRRVLVRGHAAGDKYLAIAGTVAVVLSTIARVGVVLAGVAAAFALCIAGEQLWSACSAGELLRKPPTGPPRGESHADRTDRCSASHCSW
jgi:hypothetical protein